MLDSDQAKPAVSAPSSEGRVGYKRPLVHSRFKKGKSGNPSGRAKGSQNLKTIFNKVLSEKVSLKEGSEIRKVSKGEALVRGMVVGALKGDQRNLAMLFHFAEQTGQFQDTGSDITEIQRVIVRWQVPSDA